jgi:hypothetical protein
LVLSSPHPGKHNTSQKDKTRENVRKHPRIRETVRKEE